MNTVLSTMTQSQPPLVALDKLTKIYRRRTFFSGQQFIAVSEVSFDLHSGEVIGLVGESGSGKSTVGRMVLRLLDTTGGTIRFKGVDITRHSQKAMRPLRHDMQLIFQNPYGSLNPRRRIGALIAEGLDLLPKTSRSVRRARVMDLLAKVGLAKTVVDRYPHEFSGGQRQRIAIARALACEPSLIIADEPVAALDASIQAQVMNLLMDLQAETGIAMLFISHNLTLVRNIADRVMVMYRGHVVEHAPTRALYENPRHPYTQALLAAIPKGDPRQKRRNIAPAAVKASVSPGFVSGCVFQSHCPMVQAICKEHAPISREIDLGHFASCHFN